MTAPTTRVLTPETLRARRLALGISAVRVADALGVRLSEVGRWERGEVAPDPMRWRLLAGMLHLDEAEPLWIAPRQPEPGEVDMLIDLIPADPFVHITDPAGVGSPARHLPARARRRGFIGRRVRLVVVLVLLAVVLVWATGNLGTAVDDLVGAMGYLAGR